MSEEEADAEDVNKRAMVVAIGGHVVVRRREGRGSRKLPAGMTTIAVGVPAKGRSSRRRELVLLSRAKSPPHLSRRDSLKQISSAAERIFHNCNMAKMSR